MTIEIEKLRLLVIEDRLDARLMIRNMLKEIGITQVFEASDGREGMTFIDTASDMIDLIMCDWNMPKMTGIDILRQIRTVDANMPFLMVTGRGDMESVVEAKTAGVTGYILKPFSQKQLEAKLRALCVQANVPSPL